MGGRYFSSLITFAGIKKISTAFIAGILIGVIAFCSFVNAETDNGMIIKDDKMILNQRQKDILEQHDLPLDPESLTPEARNAIVIIEDMLEYMETKYGISFYYIGYAMKDVLNDNCLICYPEGYTEFDEVKVYRKYENGSYAYYDEYELMLASKKVTSQLRSIIGDMAGDKGVFVISEVSSIEDDYDDSTALEKTCTLTHVLLSEDEFDMEKVRELAEKYCNFKVSEHNGKYSVIDFIILERSVFDQLDDYTWKNILDEEEIKYSATYQIYSDGTFITR